MFTSFLGLSLSFRFLFSEAQDMLVFSGFSGFPIGLVYSSCHNKIPQAEWLIHQTFIFLQFWILPIQDQGATVLVSSETSSWLADGHLLPVFSHGFSSHLPFQGEGERERENSVIFSSSHKDHSYHIRAPRLVHFGGN